MDGCPDLVTTLKQWNERPKILVVGDLMLDRYTSGITERTSQEAPVIVLRTDGQGENRLGGAASASHMLAALGAEVTCMGVVGNDENGRILKSHLQRANIQTTLTAEDGSRPTTTKERLVGRNGSGLPSQILRVDTESTLAIPESIENDLLCLFMQMVKDFDAILISDYSKGVCTPSLLRSVISAANDHKIPVLVDPGRDRDFSIYENVNLIKPNRVETQVATGHTISTADDAFQAGTELCTKYSIGTAVVTLDSDGICLTSAAGNGGIYPTAARSVYDITGAGDMVFAILGMCFASGIHPENAVQLANIAAGLEVDRTGVAVFSRDELLREIRSQNYSKSRKCIDSIIDATRIADEYRRRGKSVVFTNGCFDLLHVGHVTYLEEAADQGDILVVAVNSDSSVSRLKGPDRPIIAEADRVAMLSSLACVDHVVLFDSDTPRELLHAMKPDVLIKGGTYSKNEVVGYEIVEGYGGKVIVAGLVGGVSTTRIVESVSQQNQLRRAG